MVAGGLRGARRRQGEGEGEGREEGASVPTFNDSLGQPLLHMLSGEREAHMQTQTNRLRGKKGGLRGKIDQMIEGF